MTGDEADRKRAASALRGVRIAVTRPADGSDALEGMLEEAGAVVVRMPTARIEAAADAPAVRAALATADEYDWVVFTSATAVSLFTQWGGRAPASVAAVGPVTAAAAKAAGMTVRAVPADYVAEAIVPAMASVRSVAGTRVLWPRAATARRGLSEALRAAGAAVEEVVLYRTIEDAAAGRALREAVEHGDVDAITFTSPSAVRGYGSGGPAAAGHPVVAVIGPVTAAAVRAAGMHVHVEPAEHTAAAMVASLRAFYERRDQSKEGQRGMQ